MSVSLMLGDWSTNQMILGQWWSHGGPLIERVQGADKVHNKGQAVGVPDQMAGEYSQKAGLNNKIASVEPQLSEWAITVGPPEVCETQPGVHDFFKFYLNHSLPSYC